MSEEPKNTTRSRSSSTIPDPDFDMLINGQIVTLPRSRFAKCSTWVKDLLEDGKTPWMDWSDAQNCDSYIDCVLGNRHAIKRLADAFDQSHGQADESVETKKAAQTVFDRLIDLYALANWHMHDRMTANMVLDEIIRLGQTVDEIPVEPAITKAFNNTDTDETIQLLLRDYWVHEILIKGSERFLKTVKEFTLIREVAIEMLKHFRPSPEGPGFDRVVESNRSADPCYYHEHDDEEFPQSMCGLDDPFGDAEHWKDYAVAILAMDELVGVGAGLCVLPVSSIDHAYRHTEKVDALRRLLGDLWIYEVATHGGERLLTEDVDVDGKADIGAGLLPCLLPYVVLDPDFDPSIPWNFERDNCYYHNHADNPRCANVWSPD